MPDPIDNINNDPNDIKPQDTTNTPQPTTSLYSDPSNNTPDPTFPTSPTVERAPLSSSPSAVSTVSVPSNDTPFVPDETPKKSKKKLIIGIVIAVIAVLGLSGTTAFAFYYNNPEKVVADALVNVVTARTQISSGSYTYSDSKNKGKVSLTFDSKSDTPNFKGQLDAKLKVDYEKYKFDLGGSGVLSEKGNAYFKFDGLEEITNKYLNEPEIKAYTDRSPELKNDIVALVKKIDGQYVKLEKSDIQNFWKKYDHKKASACYTKVFDTLDKNPSQKKEIQDAYGNNKFVLIKDQGSENIAGTDSVKYGINIDLKKYYHASDAFDQTTFSKSLQKCNDQLSDTATDDYKPTEQEKKEERKYRDESAEEQQKDFDKTKVNIWISRWDHQFTKTTADYTDTENKTNYSLSINYKQNQLITVKDPKGAISMKEFQADIDKIQSDISKLSGGEYVSAAVSKNQTNATAIQKKAEAYAADTGAGSYPTLEQLKADRGVAKLPESLLVVISNEAPDSSHQDRVQYKVCSGSSGYSIYYWDVAKNSISEAIGYGCNDPTI